MDDRLGIAEAQPQRDRMQPCWPGVGGCACSGAKWSLWSEFELVFCISVFSNFCILHYIFAWLWLYLPRNQLRLVVTGSKSLLQQLASDCKCSCGGSLLSPSIWVEYCYIHHFDAFLLCNVQDHVWKLFSRESRQGGAFLWRGSCGRVLNVGAETQPLLKLHFYTGLSKSIHSLSLLLK